MDDVLQAPPSEHDDVRVLAACLAQAQGGIDLSYRILDQMADHRRLSHACLVVRPSRLGPQVFVRGGLPPAPELVTALLARPPGLYAAAGGVDPAAQGAFAGCCALAIDADIAGVAGTAGLPRLVSRPVVEVALARAAARSARYGWPVTAVLLAGGGDAPTIPRWRDLGAAAARAARVGDVVGVAGNGRALVLLANAGPDAVGPFVDRVTAALVHDEATGGAAGLRPVTATAAVPRETVDPEEVWRLLDERLAERLAADAAAAPATEAWTGALPTDLELELRALPGVVAVGIAAGTVEGGPQLTVVACDPSEALHVRVGRRVADRFGPDAVPVVTVEAVLPDPAAEPSTGSSTVNGSGLHLNRPVPASASEGTGLGPAPWDPVPAPWDERRNGDAHGPAPLPRVALLTARFDADTGTSEVALGRAGARATGRGSAGPLAGGVQATLAALGVLGVEVPFYLMSAERARGVPGEPVVVVLAPRHHENGSGLGVPGRAAERIGIAAGEREVEAASRATLGALNRFLAGEQQSAVS